MEPRRRGGGHRTKKNGPGDRPRDVGRRPPRAESRGRKATRAAAVVLLGGVPALLAGSLLLERAAPAHGGGASPADEPTSATYPAPAEKIAGVAFVAPPRPIGPEAVAPIRRLGADWIAVIPYALVRPDDPEVRFNTERQWWGERRDGTAATVRFAREHGLRVMLKPHLWIRGLGWVGDFAPDSEEGWRRWEESYAAYVLAFARLGDSLGVELFAVGTELDRAAQERPEFWRDLIRRVREVFGGELTYAANWDAYEAIPFWDALDYIGVDAYFPLSDAATPTVEELERAWAPVAAELEGLHRRHGRPLLFTEWGYRSVDGGAGQQWEIPDGRRARGLKPNEETQANAYEALFRVWWDRPWFAGGFVWKWYPTTAPERGLTTAPERGARTPGWRDTDYTPQEKSAEAVLRRWYGHRRAGEESGAWDGSPKSSGEPAGKPRAAAVCSPRDGVGAGRREPIEERAIRKGSER